MCALKTVNVTILFWDLQPLMKLQNINWTFTYWWKHSPFLAYHHVIHQLTLDKGVSHSMASPTYWWDIITDTSSINEVCSFRKELCSLLKSEGFELCKWSSSHSQGLRDIFLDHQQTPLIFYTEDTCFKIFGLMWDPKDDSFKYHVYIIRGVIAKGIILS